MIEVRRRTAAAPDDVWAVLADGWSYVSWVVGASRMRAVDPGWPEPGAALHHSAGLWPLLLDDETQVRDVDPGRRLELVARGRPLGDATVTITLEPIGTGCDIGMVEDVTGGPALVLPRRLRQLVIAPRNQESLRRLAFLVERRISPEPVPGIGVLLDSVRARWRAVTH